MEKIIYLLSRKSGGDAARWADALRKTLPPALQKAGAHAIRLNLDDADVAAAGKLRQTYLEQPVNGLLQFWVDSAVDSFRSPVDALVSAHTARHHAYLVVESQPLVNHAHKVAPGERTPGFAQVALLRRPEKLDFASWFDIWRNAHTAVALETQSNFEYTQNLVVHPLSAGAPRLDAIVEECFPAEAMSDPSVFFDAAGDEPRFQANLKRMMDSCNRFIVPKQIDVIPTSQYQLT